MTGAGAPLWPDRRRIERKFRQHRRDFAKHDPIRPLTDVAEYEESSVATVQNGIRFTYTDPTHGVPRIGYFDPLTGLFTAVTENGRRILTHYPADEEYARELSESNYPGGGEA